MAVSILNTFQGEQCSVIDYFLTSSGYHAARGIFKTSHIPHRALGTGRSARKLTCANAPHT